MVRLEGKILRAHNRIGTVPVPTGPTGEPHNSWGIGRNTQKGVPQCWENLQGRDSSRPDAALLPLNEA